MQNNKDKLFNLKDRTLQKQLKAWQTATWIVVAILFGSLLYILVTGLNPDRVAQIVRQPSDISTIVQRLSNDAQLKQTQEQIQKLIDQSFTGNKPNEEQLRTALLKGYVNSLGDQYSEYLTSEDYTTITNSLNASFTGIGIQFEFFGSYAEVQQVFPNTPAEKSGLKAGDRILSIEGTQMSSFDSSEVVRSKITGPENTTVKLEIANSDGIRDVTLTRQKISFPLVTYQKQGKIGVIRVSSFGESVNKEMTEIAEKIRTDPEVKFLVLDLTNNTGGYLNAAVDLVSFFVVPNSTVVIDKQKNRQETLRSVEKKQTLQEYPLVVTGNRFTASASEITIGALQDNRNTIFLGTKTFGKGVVQQIFDLTNGAALKLTIAEWYTPNNRAINKQGIQPNIIVEKDEVKTVLERYDWTSQTLKQP